VLLHHGLLRRGPMLRLEAHQPEASDTSVPAGVRELFIEDLAKVHGGSVAVLLVKIRDMLLTTHGCCEEGPTSCC
jgi:hypothetical protein